MTFEPVTFHLIGDPRGQARTGGNGRRRFTEPKTRKFEDDLRVMAKIAMRGRALIVGEPLHLICRAVFPIPESWSQVKRNKAITREILPTSRPDLSNIIKSVEDAMNKIVYGDDAYICSLDGCSKVYGVQSMVVVTVKAMHGDQL